MKKVERPKHKNRKGPSVSGQTEYLSESVADPGKEPVSDPEPKILRIGIDISQVVYEGTGVARYVNRIVRSLVTSGSPHEFVLFGGAMKRRHDLETFIRSMHALNPKVTGVILTLSPKVLDLLWNRLHVIPIEWLTGPLDIFWSSDWTQPPVSHAVGVTTIHDLSVFRYPESFDELIVSVQKRRLQRAVRTCNLFFCDSDATRHDAQEILKIPGDRLVTVYPGFSV